MANVVFLQQEILFLMLAGQVKKQLQSGYFIIPMIFYERLTTFKNQLSSELD